MSPLDAMALPAPEAKAPSVSGPAALTKIWFVAVKAPVRAVVVGEREGWGAVRA